MTAIKQLAVATVVGLSLSLLTTGKALSASFSFTKIADTEGPFSALSGDARLEPSINDVGTVVFRADLKAGGSGIFTGNGTTITTIADSGNLSVKEFQRRPSINNAGTVAFSALLNTDINGVFVGNGGAITTIADSSGPYELSRGGGWFPSINNSGIVTFSAYLDAGGAGIFASDSGAITTIVDSNGFSDLGISDINNNGAVAFRGVPVGGDEGIFVSNNGTITTIGDSSGPFSFLSELSLNNKGTVAFSASLDAGGFGIFTGNGDTISTITDSNNPFEFVYSPSINDSDTVAFQATLATGGEGIFIGSGSDPVADKVIATGDSLFGNTVTYLAFSTKGLNNSNQLAFAAGFADGSFGIFRAQLETEPPTSVPEPSYLLSLLASSVCSTGLLLKHKQKKQK